MDKEGVLLGIFSMIFIVSISMFLVSSSSITGYVSTTSASSNVTISSYISISPSDNLQDGILFGNISSLPVINLNASHNIDATSGNTSIYINVSLDSNTNVDFCIMANGDLANAGGNLLGLANESYANSTIANQTFPGYAGDAENLTTSYVIAGKNVARGAVNFFRFWLDIPVSQATGTYNNTVKFKVTTTGAGC